MKKAFLLFITLFISSFGSDNMEKAKTEGEKFAIENINKAKSEATKTHNVDDLKSEKDKGKEFDSSKIEGELRLKQVQVSEEGEFLRSRKVQGNRQKISENDSIYSDYDKVVKDPKTVLEVDTLETVEDIVYKEETCEEGGEPYPLVYRNTLVLDVEKIPAKKNVYYSCKNNRVNCPNHHNYKREYIIEEESWELKKEEWVVSDSALFEKSEEPECEFVSRKCLESGKKTIKGKEYERDCWVEELEFLCDPPEAKGCTQLLMKGCEEMARDCLQKQTDGSCSLWKKKYRCAVGGKRKTCSLGKDQNKPYCLDGSCFDSSYESDDGFMEAVSTLESMKEMKEDIESSGLEGDNIKVFKGDSRECAKNIAGALMYDCCRKMKGLATALNFTNCEDEEKDLAQRREQGKCHYVGRYKRKVIGLFTSSKKHVYCCFNSKLSRIIQEQGRKQLGLGWGAPKSPSCNGFSLNEIEKLDFSKLDLREYYSDLSKKVSMPSKEKQDFALGLKEGLDRFKDGVNKDMEDRKGKDL